MMAVGVASPSAHGQAMMSTATAARARETPRTLNTSAGNDQHSTRFGFRTARFTTEGFFLNGKPLKIRGLNRHQSYPYVGYAMGQHAADWLEGKSIPQAMDILPSALTAANIAAYERDLADPGAIHAEREGLKAWLGSELIHLAVSLAHARGVLIQHGHGDHRRPGVQCPAAKLLVGLPFDQT